MKTLKRGFFLRLISVVLTLMMVFSVLSVGIISTSAAEVNLAETGASRTFAAGDYIYVKNFKPSGWSANWFHSDVTEWMHIWNSSTNVSLDVKFELIEGTENADGAVYGAKITTAGTYTHVIFTRSHSDTDPWNNCNQTGDIPLDATNNCYTNLAVGGTSYTGSVFVPGSGGSGGDTEVDGDFWVDLDGDPTTTLDVIIPDKNGSVYDLYLPSLVSVNSSGQATLTFFVAEGKSLTIGGASVSSTGSAYAFYPNSSYTLGGSFSGTLALHKSSAVSSIHTTTATPVPQGTYQGYESKDDYETKGSIVVYGPDGTQKNSDTVLKKIKGRGNSSWEASHKIIGKYAFNITLDKKAQLLDESSASKKYCLVSYNADEARMRNMIVYELAQQIGVEYVPDYEPVDFYNNGLYIGSYLLTDKVEIGDPLVDIVDLDGINEDFSENNTALYDDDSLMTRASSNGNINDTSTKGYYKYISNLDEPDASEYAESGFLLEFELNERFSDEISGFISTKGQQIVCKYPEFATKNEIKFIRDKWNTAEALMYDDTATYEELDAVIDVESFAKMYLIQELTKNLDGGATSYYVYYHEGKLHAGVAWDYDWTLGQYAKTYTDRVNTGSDFYDKVDADPSESGGWYLNSKTIYGASDFNAQAALCQNDAFWSVVVAEWDEIFFSEANKFTNGEVSSVSSLGGIIADFYSQVKASTAMDEDKWGLIQSDPFITNNWGSTDTGDTHDDAVKWLNNWYYERILWMDKYISTDGSSHTGIYDIDYVIQPPTITADKELYAAGETVTLTIDDKTDGDYYYKIYKNGAMWQVVSGKTVTFTAEKSGATEYTVFAVSNTSAKTSDFSEPATVNVQGYVFSVDVTAPETILASKNIVINATSDAEEEVTYNLYLTGDTKELIGTNNTGTFTVPTTLADGGKSFRFTVEASVTVDGETYTDEKVVDVSVTEFELILNVSAPETVEAGMILTVKATAEADTEVVYEFYTGDGTLLVNNTSGIYTEEITVDDIGTKSYYVIAKTTVEGKVFTAETKPLTVTVTTVKEAYDVKICFKSADTLAYAPYITTEGAVDNLSSEKMTKGTFICKNATETASYYWYEADVQVSKAAPQLEVTVVGSRYALEGYIHLNITESGTVYLALENINFTRGNELQNLTSWDETERNWTMSAANMIYDEGVDKASFSEVAARINLRTVGDANGDGAVNVKDATAIQKHLAEIVTLDSLAVEISDINSDGKVTVKDATAIQKKLVALL